MTDLLLFWNHRPEPDGRIGPGCLSQFWPVEFTADGERFAAAEHYMMWRKARLFDDHDTAAAVLAEPTPAGAKALGRTVTGFSQDRWSAHRLGIVVDGNRAKFSAHDDLRAYLLSTGERTLVEASPHDRVWGIGLSAEDPDARDPQRWRGLNLLGTALMTVRTELAQA